MKRADRGEYDYLNARVRGMAASLLSSDLIEQILQSESEDLLVDALLDSPYGGYLSDTLANRSGAPAIENALKRNLYDTVAKIRSMAPANPLRLLDIQLGRFDITNVVTILRGIRRKAAHDEIMRAMVPAGSHSPVQLEELAKEPDETQLANSLATWDSPLEPTVRRGILEGDQANDYSRVESDLYAAYYLKAFEELETADTNARILRDHLRLQADMQNVVCVLKQVEKRSRNQPEPEVELVPGGFISPSVLKRIHDAKNMEIAFELLDATEFAPAIEKGILAFGRSNRLSAIERFLEALVLERGAQLYRKDPLSVSVPLGFIWRKISEFTNLRVLARGKRYHFPAGAMREEMVNV